MAVIPMLVDASAILKLLTLDEAGGESVRLLENSLAAIGESLVSVPVEPQPINHLSSNLEK